MPLFAFRKIDLGPFFSFFQKKECEADPNGIANGIMAEAYGGLGAVAAEAGISRESLYRTLSPKGNLTLKTLLAVLKALGMRLSVEPVQHAAARSLQWRLLRILVCARSGNGGWQPEQMWTKNAINGLSIAQHFSKEGMRS